MSNTGIMYAAKDLGTRPDLASMPHRYGRSSRTVDRNVGNEKNKQIDVKSYVSARYTDLKNSIEEVMRECAEDDWDEEGSLAVNKDSVEFALQYFSIFIEGELPHISCDPFGCIIAEWYGNAALAAIAFQTDKVYHVLGYNKKIRHFSEKTDDSRMAHKFIAELGF
jgi:hypothetical protein